MSFYNKLLQFRMISDKIDTLLKNHTREVGASNGKVRNLRQERYLRYQGISLSQTQQQNIQAQR